MANSLYEENLARIKRAVTLEPTDRVPYIPVANAYFAKSEGITLKDYITNFELATDTNLKAADTVGGVDGTQNILFSPWLLTDVWLSPVYMPGRELGDDEMWQVIEAENLTREDYDVILNNGFESFYEKYLIEKCGDPNKNLAPFFEYLPTATQRLSDAGIPCVCGFIIVNPFEMLCGSRSLENFFMDLLDIPDKVEAVCKVIMEFQLKKYDAMLGAIKPHGVWIGGWRSAPDMLSMEIWERFVWPWYEPFTELVLSHDVIPTFHLDSCWDRGLEHFRGMPAKKCIMGLDSKTNIRLAKKTLGDMMCILGDVPAEILAFGQPEEVFDHSTELINDIGPTGYILASGCDIPSNGKKENIKAMRDAALKYKY